MQEQKAEFVELDLNIKGKPVPYVVMYSYAPKHEAFIIARLAKEELR